MPRGISAQCIGINKRNGQRCKRKTARGPLCYAHLEIEKHLKIKKSGIPRGGLGLFTTKPIKKNQNVVPYGGLLVRSNDPDFGGDYVLQLARGKFLDGNPKKTNTSIGAFSNHCKRADQLAGFCSGNNIKFTPDQRNNSANLKATKNINNASVRNPKELFSTYGQDYWRVGRKKKLN